MERRLAAILAADVVGYTRLMREDEVGTLERLKAHREAVFDPLIAKNRGRIVKLMGDGALVEFSSVIEAVCCAAELQRGMAERNVEVPEERRITFRIGINLGDVIIEGDDLYGDGVNLAARLEGLAEPGGICVSAKVYEEVRTKLDLAYQDLGPKEIKNVAEPIRAYRIAVERPVAVAASSTTRNTPFPDKPSIAVLPFTNLSDDPEQEYFSDGITEDVITELSRFHSLFVIARNSSFTYKGRAVDVRDIGRELGVRYLVEGSVRKSGRRVRVTAQLVEAETGNHLWAERYDGELEDIFAVQDQVVGAIVGALGGRLLEAQKELSFRKKTGNLDAYDYYLRGLHFWRKYDPENNLEALHLFETAVTHDPDFAEAHALLAFTSLMNYWWQAESSGETFDRPLALARRSVELDPHNSLCHAVLGYVYLVRREHEHGRHHIERAISLNPHDFLSISFHAMLLWWTGNPEKALLQVEAAQEFEPFPPSFHWENRGGPLYQLGRFEEAAESYEKIPSVSWWNHGYLAACYGQLGEPARAQRSWQEVLRLRPGTSFEDVAKSAPFKNEADEELWLEGLRKAALPK
jgi:adenylate cyclase